VGVAPRSHRFAEFSCVGWPPFDRLRRTSAGLWPMHFDVVPFEIPTAVWVIALIAAIAALLTGAVFAWRMLFRKRPRRGSV
jgi:hypothetical protein